MARIPGRKLLGGTLALAVGIGVFAVSHDALAGHRHHYHGGDLLAAGVLGAVVGSLVAPPIYAAPRPVYVYPEPVYVYPEPVVVYPEPAPPPYYGDPRYPRRSLDDLERGSRSGYDRPGGRRAPGVVTYEETVGGGSGVAWTPEWYRYCSNRFRTFDRATGTYMGYDGERHFCVIR